MNLYDMTWPQVEEYLKTKKSIIFPVGSTEQHGPNGSFGIDFITAWEVAKAVGQKTGTMVASPLTIGMAWHHMGFPGTMTLSPGTYTQVIKEIVESFIHHGFTKITLINGHGGNIAPITTAFCDVKVKNESAELKLINWWHDSEVQKYEKENFADKNGFHATIGEVSVTMYLRSQEYEAVPKIGDLTPSPAMKHWPMSPKEFRSHFTDGRMGSHPELANRTHGEKIFNIAVESISKLIGAR